MEIAGFHIGGPGGCVCVSQLTKGALPLATLMLAPQSAHTGRMPAYHAAGLLSLTPQLQVTSQQLKLSQSGSYEIRQLQLFSLPAFRITPKRPAGPAGKRPSYTVI
jgi:hypothetical protein